VVWHYFWHITLMNILNPLTQISVVPRGWSISTEVLFYISVPLWFKWIKNLSQAYVFTVIGVFVLPLITSGIRMVVDPYWVHMNPSLIYLYWYFFPLTSLGCFSFGILLFFLLKEEGLIHFFQSKAINAWTLLAICLLWVSLSTVNPRLPIQVHIYSFLFMSLALMLSAQAWKLFVNPVMVFIGRISYSAFMVHCFVLRILSDSIAQYSPGILKDQNVYFFVVVVFGIAITLPFAWCGYRFIELPAINISKRLIQLFEIKDKELLGAAI